MSRSEFFSPTLTKLSPSLSESVSAFHSRLRSHYIYRDRTKLPQAQERLVMVYSIRKLHKEYKYFSLGSYFIHNVYLYLEIHYENTGHENVHCRFVYILPALTGSDPSALGSYTCALNLDRRTSGVPCRMVPREKRSGDRFSRPGGP